MSTKPTKEKKTLAGGKAVPAKVDKKPTKSAKADDDDWEKVEEEEEWDPDFEEFDLPKSKGKKSPGKKPAAVDEDEDFKIDDEFKDIFNDSDAGFDDEDDDF